MRQYHRYSLDAGSYGQRHPGVAEPKLVWIRDPFEPSIVADQGSGILLSNRIEDGLRAGSEFDAVGEALPLRVHASVLAIPSYREPGFVSEKVALGRESHDKTGVILSVLDEG